MGDHLDGELRLVQCKVGRAVAWGAVTGSKAEAGQLLVKGLLSNAEAMNETKASREQLRGETVLEVIQWG